MKTITADQARVLSDENTKINIDFNLEQVYLLIEKECKKGKLASLLAGKTKVIAKN